MHGPRISAILLALLASAAAMPPADSVREARARYSRRVWQSADGLPEDFAQALAQGPDGYLWIGSSGGLVRFDGVRFTVFSSQTVATFHDDSVYSLLMSPDGTLWAGTEGGGLIRYRDGEFRAYGAREGLSNGFVRVLFRDRAGTLWVGTDDGLFRMQQDRLFRVDGRDGIAPVAVHSICEDRNGRILAGGSGLLILDHGTSAYYMSSENLADNSIRTIHQTADGTVWIGTISGLRRLERGVQGNPFLAPKIIAGTNVDLIAESRSGVLWIGTYGKGIILHENGRFSRLTAPSLLPHNNVLSILEDAEDDIWIGTQGGLLRLSPSAGSTVTTADGVPQSINTIYQDPQGSLFAAALNGRLFRVSGQTLEPAPLPADAGALTVRNVFRESGGALWLGTDGQGAVRLTDGGEQRFTMKQGLINDFVRAFCESRDGSIWIGTDGGVSRWHNGTFQSFNTRDGLAYGSIRAIVVDRAGSVWIATDGGLSRFGGEKFVKDPVLDRFQGQKVWALFADTNGGLWIGTHGEGLFLFKDGKLAQFDTRTGLPSNKIHFIAEGAHGNLWVSGPAGVFSVDRSELESLALDPSREPAVRIYGTSDGLSTNQMTGGVQPAGALTPAGEFWFPSTKGAVCIRPDPAIHGSPRPVVIEQVLADDRPVPLADQLRLGPGAGKIEVHYTAVRLRSPERTRFRYWMEGFDPGWTEAGQRRIAYYTNLPSGDYRFHVVAYELNDPNNAAERVLNIGWRPHFYQTSWFVGLCALALLLAACGAYYIHVSNIRKRFAAVLEERNRLAREMHDTLIQGCVGVSALLEAASTAQQISPAMSNDLVDRARNEVRATVDEARLAVWNLRHGAANGDLVSSVTELGHRIGLETGIPVNVETTGTAIALPGEHTASVLMLVREALQNAVRHAGPRNLSVKLVFHRRMLDVSVEDDGCGFEISEASPVDERHYGLIGMRERVSNMGGDFHISTAPGQGVKVRFRVPASNRVRMRVAAVAWLGRAR